MKTLAGIVLAAGSSSRLGRPKQLVALHGKSLVARATDLAQRYCDAGVVVVTGAHHDQVVDALGETDALAVFNPRWKEGMGASVSEGASAVCREAEAVLIMLTDQPLIDAADIGRLVAAAQANPDKIAAAAYAGRLGVPAIFPQRYVDDLKHLQGDQGARMVISREVAVSEVAMPNAQFDLDTPEALAELTGNDSEHGR